MIKALETTLKKPIKMMKQLTPMNKKLETRHNLQMERIWMKVKQMERWIIKRKQQ